MRELRDYSKGRSTAFFFLFLIALIISGSCSKNNDPRETQVSFLGHKGAGNNGYNDHNLENTISAVREGVQMLDGVEVDVQMSLDGTIWLFHDEDNVNDLNCSGTTEVQSIPSMYDSEIEKIQLCHKTKKDRLYKLSEVITFYKATPGGFFLSLDVKVSFPAEVMQVVGGKNAYLLRFADSLASVIGTVNPEKIMVEIDSRLFCEQLKSHPNAAAVKTFFMRYEPFDQKIENAIELGYDGVSCNFTDETITPEKIRKAQEMGLLVQLWTPYFRDEVTKTFSWNPDFIQTDNIRAKTGLNVK
ncbi:MAG TPA: glycerophosphodiester phosphodiesterase [Sphingobacteriaceae bacterium]